MTSTSKGLIKRIKSKLKKITLIQLIVLLVVVSLTVAVVKFFGKQGEWRLIKVQVIGKDWSNSFVSYDGYRPPYWLAESINEGDVELSADGGKLAEVIKVESYKRIGSEYDLYLILKVNGVLNTRTNKYAYKGRAIEVGAPIDIRLNNALVIAQVIDDQVPESGYETKEAVITGRIRNAEPWVVSNLNDGDIMTNGSRGETVAEILTITTEPAQSQIIFSDPSRTGVRSSTGTLIAERNPRLKDIVLTAKLVVERHGNEWYFGGHQNIKAGNLLWLYLPQVDLRFIEVESVEDVISNESAK